MFEGFKATLIRLAVAIYTRMHKLLVSKIEPCIISSIGSYYVAIPRSPGNYLQTHKVYLVVTDGVKYEITQPPGTSYSHTAQQLGGTHFIVKSVNTDEEIQVNEIVTVNNRLVRKRLE